jgi:hypothetical protein
MPTLLERRLDPVTPPILDPEDALQQEGIEITRDDDEQFAESFMKAAKDFLGLLFSARTSTSPEDNPLNKLDNPDKSDP